MSWFQPGKKPGTKPLRLLVLAGVLAFALAGCGTSRYETVDLNLQTADGSAESKEGTEQAPEMLSITLGETTVSGPGQNETGSGDGAAGTPEIETSGYQETDDYIVVTTDALNVRETDSTDSRIFVQLPAGEILHRTGYNEEWCRIDYDGGTAYVAAGMVEVTEAPETTVSEETAAAEGETGSEEAAGSAKETGSEGETQASEGESPVYARTGTAPNEEAAVPLNGHVVAIDAGHQAKANAEKEPIGPSSETMKAKMPAGATGTVTGVKEYELTLTVAEKLEAELLSRGYEVVMVRTGHDVNLSNAERSIIANDSGAEIFIRLHANSMENSGVYGVMAMCMTEYNPYNAGLSADSYSLSKMIVNNICSRTGTRNRGVQRVDNSSEINWCEIPVSVVEMGFLSNPDEDRWLQSDDYQDKIVAGIAEAVDSYFSERN